MGSDADLQQSPMLPQMESFLYMLAYLRRVAAVRQFMREGSFRATCRRQFMNQVS